MAVAAAGAPTPPPPLNNSTQKHRTRHLCSGARIENESKKKIISFIHKKRNETTRNEVKKLHKTKEEERKKVQFFAVFLLKLFCDVMCFKKHFLFYFFGSFSFFGLQYFSFC